MAKKQKTKRIVTTVTLNSDIYDALDSKVAETGSFRSHIIEAALIKSKFLDLPKGMKAGMGKHKTGRPASKVAS